MKLYFAGVESKKSIDLLVGCEIKSVLVSYFSMKNKSLKNHFDSFGDVFLDSGAFSAFTRKSTIDIDKYVNYIKDNKDYITVYANLDVIGDWKKTRENQEYMESQGLSPLPIFHFGSPLDELKRLCEKYDYIALGGLVPLALKKNTLKRWLDICFSVIPEKVKVHGFGVNATWAWKRYNFYSVDATSWLSSTRYGGATFKKRLTIKNDKRFNSLKSEDKCELAIKSYNNLSKEINYLWKIK